MNKSTLSTYHPADSGVIEAIAVSELSPKLVEMGLYKGKKVKVLFRAPFGGPMAVDIGGSVLSLRLEEAELVEMESHD